jgi:UDP-N-acetylmuramyl pentapeptide phosphotransferase/UDP-N-acetylglucosamine-1-phosphate transferase
VPSGAGLAVMGILTFTLRPLASRLQLTDRPGSRKHHIGEILLVVGIAMLIGVLVRAMLALETTSRWAFLVPAALLVIVGVRNADEREAAARIATLTLSCCMAHKLVAVLEELGFRRAKVEGERVLHELASAAAPAASGAVTVIVELPE